MTIIATKLTKQQFKQAFADEPLVENLSEEAVDHCLEAIEKLQAGQTNPSGFDWREVFKSATEITSEQLVAQYKEELNRRDYDDHLLSVASTVDFDADLSAIMANEEGNVSDHMLIRDNLDALLEYPDFLEGTAAVLGRDNFWRAFSNGCWFKLV